MDKKLMCAELPKEAPGHILDMVLKKHLDELGGQRTIYKRVNVVQYPELTQIMTPDDWDEYYTQRRNRWAAECTCTVCGDTWHTQWRGGPLKAILIAQGEDGLTYPCIDEEDSWPGSVIEVAGNDGFLCPICNCVTTLTHISNVRNGRRWQLSISSIDNVGGYTTIFYWLVHRDINSDGIPLSGIRPWNAYVIDEQQRLRRFIFDDYTETWRYSSSCGDAYYSMYTSKDGNLYNYRYGGFPSDVVPSLIGYTGEKTGLQAYSEAGGALPVLYMKTWMQHPAIENLVVAGWAGLIEQLMQTETNSREIPYAILPGIDFTSAKPHAMLRMDKISFRQLSQKFKSGWSETEHEAWLKYLDSGGVATAAMFNDYYRSFKLSGINVVISLRSICSAADLPQIDRYLSKQGLHPDDVHLLLDSWRMTMQLFGRAQLTSEELWPRDLFGTHERLSRMVRLEQSKDDWTKYLEGFISVRDRYRDLEWTDGELCVVLPKDNGDLIREGDVLRHCVYSYGADHVSGQHTIFFVRKYRRPERSYYTLDINMIGLPTEQQLHGYGNEHHGPHKEYLHSIPKKVRDFCDRWKREVLIPWYREQQRQAARNTNSESRKEAKTA